ncbi:MAG TPA: D-alanyl-D-alanine carboxypeptidase, partial [Mycobacteriales bacterium]|nr:D-alanyl-D-alanine carboxypeptidase [Mycobacteriales bacterium]
APGVPALPADLPSSSWLVADVGTGAVLAARDPHGRYLPASTLKVLTAITLIPRLNPNRVVVPSFADVSVDGSKVGLVDTMGYTVRLLFTTLLVVSGNDAANTLADAAGGIRKTLALMNQKARELQADDTVALTPSGLDAPGESSSAYDLALIARAGLAMPAFRHYIAIISSTVPAPGKKHFQIYTHNWLLTDYPGAIGVKNGYTVAAQGTYIGAATRGGRTLLVTMMHANPLLFPEARALLDWGFAADGRVQPAGVLVDPLGSGAPANTQPGAAAAPLRADRAASGRRPATSTGLALPGGVLAASTAVVTVVTRRRRRRYRSRLRLPRI